MGDAPPAVEARCLSKRYGGRTVLDCVSLEAGRGELVAVVGPNGAGKSTLLRILAGLEEPDGGSLRAEKPLGLVFQENMLLPWRSLRDNIAMGLRYRRLPRGEAEERVRRAAELLGIAGYLDRRPGEVSGGTARKAAVARMLVLEPRVLLLDEPLAGLDAASRRSLLEALRRIADGGRAVILVDHSLADVAAVADRVYVLSPPPGRVAAVLDLAALPPGERAKRLAEAMLRLAR